MNKLDDNYKTMFKDYPDVVDIKQLREILNIGITKAYKLVNNNIIHSRKVGREYKIPKLMIIEYLTTNN